MGVEGFIDTCGWLVGSGWLVGIGVLLLAAVVLHFIIAIVLTRLHRRFRVSEKPRRGFIQTLPRSLKAPLLVLIWAVALCTSLQILAFQFDGFFSPLLFAKGRRLALVVCGAWFLHRWRARTEGYYHQRVVSGKLVMEPTQLSLIGKVVTLAIWLVVIILVLQIFGQNMAALATIGGFGTIAIGFAGKDVFANFFGGMMLYVTRPFKVGEYVTSPDRSFDGIIEKIGWYLTVIRAIDKRPIFVPNAIFSSVVVYNGSKLYNRCISLTLRLRHQDLDKIPAIRDQIEKLLIEHSEINGEWAPIVRLSDIENYSLNVFVRAYTQTTDYGQFMRLKEEILLKLGDIVRASDAELAFPTTTLDMPASYVDGAS